MNKEIRIREGCGKNFTIDLKRAELVEFQCGVWRDVPVIEAWSKMLWCPLCAEKIIKELDSQILNNTTEKNG